MHARLERVPVVVVEDLDRLLQDERDEVRPFARCLGIGVTDAGVLHMPFSQKIIGNPVLPEVNTR